MHGLRHLQLGQNQLTNDGLREILDSCPHLESLDLRHCFNLNLEGDLGKRCTEQIKQLRLPNDSSDDYEFPATPYGFANFWEYIGSNDCEDPNCYDDLNDYTYEAYNDQGFSDEIANDYEFPYGLTDAGRDCKDCDCSA
ncbi:unnamed protein product [Prunus armeniaca]|uniref:Uncharacterized protein n=1 Tax=Prunus armeniaca TaxID=36596 RepID=A0A6J5UKN8_PRUAR|nr:unnamed protein product [Prunus armeniaca]